jgi:Sperm-tail PG-rich repeat
MATKTGEGSFTMRDGPGPGAYNSQNSLASIKGAVSFGKGNPKGMGDLEASKKVPGPGQYEIRYD